MTVAVLLLVAVAGVVMLPRARDRDSRVHKAIAKLWALVPQDSDSAVMLPLELASADLSPPSTSLPPLPWRWVSRDAARLEADSSGLGMIATAESVWWMNRQGPALWVLVDGDVQLQASVRARRLSDSAQPVSHEWQFGGVMLRDPRGNAAFSLENYVFVVVGHRGSKLQVEFKSTRDGDSDVRAVDWPSGDATLRVVRRGARVEVAVRDDASGEWHELAVFERADLPPRLEASLITYAYSEGRGRFDLRASFRDVSVSPP